MRIPETCPWCGAERTTIADEPAAEYACGWRSGWSAGHCARRTGPAPWGLTWEAYWRRRLSQHTGVPLRECPEVSSVHTWEGRSVGGITIGHKIAATARKQTYIHCWADTNIVELAMKHRDRAIRRLSRMKGART
jgi:hypothetical protein